MGIWIVSQGMSGFGDQIVGVYSSYEKARAAMETADARKKDYMEPAEVSEWPLDPADSAQRQCRKVKTWRVHYEV